MPKQREGLLHPSNDLSSSFTARWLLGTAFSRLLKTERYTVRLWRGEAGGRLLQLTSKLTPCVGPKPREESTGGIPNTEPEREGWKYYILR